MTFELQKLGPYRIEKTEEFNKQTRKDFVEMIRVRESKPNPPYFKVPSHIYKFSDSELCLYLHERKNLWRNLAKVLNIPINISDPEIAVRFPISKFKEVAAIVPFVKKRGLGSNHELAKSVGQTTQFNKKRRHKMDLKVSNFNERSGRRQIIPLGIVNSKKEDQSRFNSFQERPGDLR